MLFVVWLVTSWVLSAGAAAGDAMGLGRGAERCGRRCGVGRCGGKLIEINLVMGIVKIALLVLAMVFSACPLPFSSVETQTFLACWWSGWGCWCAWRVGFLSCGAGGGVSAALAGVRFFDCAASARGVKLHRKAERLNCSGGLLCRLDFMLLEQSILIIGVVYVCHLAHVPQHWVMAIALLLLGAGIMGAVSRRGRRIQASQSVELECRASEWPAV